MGGRQNSNRDAITEFAPPQPLRSPAPASPRLRSPSTSLPMATSAPTKRPCNQVDQCDRRDCYFGHPSGDLCPSFPQPCRNFAQCRCRHPPSTTASAVGAAPSPPQVQARDPCRDGDACTRADCRFYHTGGILCRYYQSCQPRDGFACAFRHPTPSQPAPAPIVPMKVKKQSKSKDGGPRAPKEPSPAKPKNKTQPKTKGPSAPKAQGKAEAAPVSSSPGKPGAKSKQSPEQVVNRALQIHDRIIQKEEERFRQAVIESSQRALSDVDGSDELTRRALQAKLQELRDQRAVFVELSRRISTGHGVGGVPLQEPARSHLLKRELFRFSARLPALAKRLEIERNLTSTASRFTVIQGQIGSGKSTQIPQYAADLPDFAGKRIICTQPRKLAATSLAARVAFEYSSGWDKALVGGDVGFRVGGRYKASKRTRIEYVTEAVLLDMIARARHGTDANPFEDVECIIVDEAHERSITCDLIMGSLKENHTKWRHVKVAVTSATIDLDLFSGFFNNAPVVEIPGRMFPVDVQYVEQGVVDASNVATIVSKWALMIQQTFPDWNDGDILCFLPGQDDVLRAKDLFESGITRLMKASPATDRALLQCVQAHALFGKQDADEQALVFKKQPGSRKVIFSTDVAETSVTIDGVVFVVDSGLRKAMIYDPVRNMSSLKVHTISRSSALQRCGRAGRTRPGRCFRLYSQQDFDEMEIGNAAELSQQPLTLTLLTLYHVGIVPQDFHWIEAPNADAMQRAQAELLYLGAIDARGSVTPMGRLVAEVQVDPKLVRLIDRSAREVLTQVGVDLAAVLSVANIAYYRGNKNDKASKVDADAKREKLLIPDQGDVVSLYRTYRAWKAELEGASDDNDESALSPAKPEISADDNEEEEEEEEDTAWRSMIARNLIQLTLYAKEAVTRVTTLATIGEDDDDDGETPYQMLRDDGDDDDDKISVVSTDSKMGSAGTDAPTACHKKPKRKRNEKKARAWCLKNGVNSKAMGIAYAMAKELMKTLSRAKLWTHAGVSGDTTVDATNEQLRRLLTAGFFLNAAVSKPRSAAVPRRGGPQYYALYSGVLGTLFMGTSVHLVEKQGGTAPAWVLFDSILRLNSTTFFSLATPIDEAWIQQESPAFYELCSKNRAELPVETIEFGDLSLPLLKTVRQVLPAVESVGSPAQVHHEHRPRGRHADSVLRTSPRATNPFQARRSHQYAEEAPREGNNRRGVHGYDTRRPWEWLYGAGAPV